MMPSKNNLSFFGKFAEIQNEMISSVSSIQPVLPDAILNIMRERPFVSLEWFKTLDLVSKLQPEIEIYSSFAPALQALSKEVAAVSSLANLDSLRPAIDSVTNLVSHIDWYSNLDFVLPVLEEGLENEPESVKEIPKSLKERRPLTLDQLCSLFSLLITILSFVWQIKTTQPDHQKEELIRQGEIQIQQNERIIELLEAENAKSQGTSEDIVVALVHAAEDVANEIRVLAGNETTDESENEDNSSELSVDDVNDFTKQSSANPESDFDNTQSNETP